MGKYKPGIKKTEKPEPASPSEVNIVLLGRTGAGKSASGNTILGEKKFESKFGAKSKTRECKEATAVVSGRRVTVLDTPGLYDTTHGMERIEDEIQKVKEFSCRGQCIFLPVIELGQFTEEEEKSIEKILGSFSEEPLNKFMILFTNGDKLEGQTIQEFLEEADENLLGVLNKFGNRCHVFNNESNPEDRQVVELLKKIDDMLMGIQNFSKVTEECFTGPREPNEIELIWQEMNLDGTMFLEGEVEETTQEPLRLVLLGKAGTGKSATGNTILGSDGFESKGGVSAVTKEFQKIEGVVCGRKVAVVDTPGFFGNSGSKEEITKEVVKSVCLSAPGPHALLLVISLNERLTTDAKDTIKELHNRFGEDFKKHAIILFSHLDKLDKNKMSVRDLIKSDPELYELLRPFENRIHAFDNNKRNNRGQVKELLEKIDNMVTQNGGGYYTDEMYRMAQEAIAPEADRLFKEHEEEICRRVMEQLQKKNASGNGAGKDGNRAGEDGNGAGEDGNRAGEDGNGAGEDGNGAGVDGNGAGEDGNGAGEDGNGAGEDGNGTGVDGKGAGKDGNGAGEDGNGAGEDGNGAGVDGNGAGEDGNRAGEDGNEAGEDGNGAGEVGNINLWLKRFMSILRRVCETIAALCKPIHTFLEGFPNCFKVLRRVLTTEFKEMLYLGQMFSCNDIGSSLKCVKQIIS